jgi:hypothetical protein
VQQDRFEKSERQPKPQRIALSETAAIVGLALKRVVEIITVVTVLAFFPLFLSIIELGIALE